METRLNILLENNVIDAEVYEYAMKIFQEYALEHNWNETATEVFLTHLAMASQRIRNDDVVAPMDDFILNEIKESDHFASVLEVTEKILEHSQIPFPESEKQYIWLHLTNVLNSQQED
ncbi:PRD domain-containing protein [Erysipelothrix sp. D19-032]|uniref:PRD domain-containing protein n=1 Tax=Erysipelothrix aquatica TaxID=2683714 RepID=UPI00135AF1C4|nr:PRD domain-containing protein [Erysipelothrix aquatica]